MKLTGIVVSMALLAGLLLMPGVVRAGGWAVVSLDRVPADVVAGEEVDIGFRVLQHGQRPMEGLEAHIEATHQESGRQMIFSASDAGTPGHYSAAVTLPETGTWDWAVVTFGGRHSMYPLEVYAAKAIQDGLQAGLPPEGEAQSSWGVWDWMAVGSGIGAGVTILAAAGVAAGIPARKATRTD